MGIENSRGYIVNNARKSRTLYNSKKSKIEDLRISVCAECRAGIFKNRDDYVWTKRGLMHILCVKPEDYLGVEETGET